MVPENPEAGVSGLVGVLALDPSGDLDLVEFDSDVASELSVPVCGTCLYSRLVALVLLRRRIGSVGGSDPCGGTSSSESENGVATAIAAIPGVSFGVILSSSTGATMLPSRLTVHLARVAACSCVRIRAGSAGRSRTIWQVLML